MIDTPVDRLERILDAAQTCLVKHGIRKTTMEDIAAEAGMSRPAVYQYVRGKQDAYRRLSDRLYSQTLVRAQGPRPPTAR
jgi:AcrR family transcriptional regulator